MLLKKLDQRPELNQKKNMTETVLGSRGVLKRGPLLILKRGLSEVQKSEIKVGGNEDEGATPEIDTFSEKKKEGYKSSGEK